MILTTLLLATLCTGTPTVTPAAAGPGSVAFQGGVCWVGPADPAGLQYLRQKGAQWVSVTPFGYGHKEQHAPPEGGYQHSTHRGESIEGVRTVIRTAHKQSLKVMLKPHIWFNTKDSWRGAIEMKSDEDWATWFRMYREFLEPYVAMAAAEKVEILCIATELNGTVAREQEWRALIKHIRARYKGTLTYAANWYQEYERVAFWDALDAIGVQAYFPLTQQQEPTVDEISAAWQPWKLRLRALAARTSRPVLLTEFGYKPVVGTTIEPWKWRDDGRRSAQAQRDAYEGAFQALHQEPWFRGVYVWKWYAGVPGGSKRRRISDNFSPQGFPAEQTMFRWFQKLAPTLPVVATPGVTPPKVPVEPPTGESRPPARPPQKPADGAPAPAERTAPPEAAGPEKTGVNPPKPAPHAGAAKGQPRRLEPSPSGSPFEESAVRDSAVRDSWSAIRP